MSGFEASVTWVDLADAFAGQFCANHKVPAPERGRIEAWAEKQERKRPSEFLADLEEWLRSRAVMRNAK